MEKGKSQTQIQRQKDQFASLAKTAQSGRSQAARIEAISKLDDQKFLADIAVSDASNDIRAAAIKRLRNQDILCQIALNEKSPWLREEATKRITRQSSLLEIAQKTDEYLVGMAAVELMTRQKLFELCTGSADIGLQTAALNRIHDKGMLKEIAEKQPDLSLFVEERLKKEESSEK